MVLDSLEVPLHSEKTITKKKNVSIEYKPVPYLQLYRFATVSDKIWLIFAVILCGASALCCAIFSYEIGYVTGAIVDYLYGKSSAEDAEALNSKLSSQLLQFLTKSMIIGVFILFASFMTTTIFSHAALRQTHTIKKKFLVSLLNQDVPWFDVNQTGDFATRMTDDLNRIQDGIGYKVGSLLFVTFNLITNVTLAFTMSWKLTFICMTLFPLQLGLIFIVGWVSSKLCKNELDAYADAGAIVEETLGAVRTVYAFEGQIVEQERYHRLLKVAAKNNIKRALINGVNTGLSSFFGYVVIGFTLWIGIKFVMDDRDLPEDLRRCDASTLVTIIFTLLNGVWSFLILAPPVIQTFSGAKAGASKIFAVIDNESSINTSKFVGRRLGALKGDVEFQDVYFSYPSREDVDVLKGLSFKVQAGETVALVGASGCGKSTCVQLIQRFYDVEGGCVLIDGRNVAEYNLSWLRSCLGVVEQEPVLFEMTVGENIRLGCKNVSDEDVVDAARKANAHDFIENLPDGYETVVGERGTQLSGGQKQRVAIARALVRKPAVLLLDEATSSLDIKSESLVQSAIDNISHERTTVIIAHRLSTIRKADKIVVVSNGRVVEEGTHQTLMQMKGEYFNLITSQITIDEVDCAHGEEDSNTTSQISLETQTEKQRTVLKTHSATLTLVHIVKMGLPELWTTLFGSANSILVSFCFCFISILYGNIVAIMQHGDFDYVMTHRDTYGLYFLYVAIATAVGSILQHYMLGRSGEKLILRIRCRMFQTVLTQNMSWFDNKDNAVGAVCVRLSSDAAVVQKVISQCFGSFLYMTSTFVIAIASSFYYEWRITLATLALYPILLFSIALELKILSDDSDKLHKSLQKTTKLAVEAISNIRTVASLGCEDAFLQKYLTELGYHDGQVRKTIVYRGLVQGISNNIFIFCYCIGLYYGGILVMRNEVEFANVFITTDLLAATSWCLQYSATFLVDFEKGYTAAQRIVRFLQERTKSQTGKEADAQNDIIYDNVHFTYPERPNALILKGLDLTMLQGKIVALVGQSGCGKSTVIQLLQRFYDPDFGRVVLGSDDVKSLKLSSLRFNLGVVSQEPNLFGITIRENIAYGDNSRDVTDQEVVEAAKKANIHNFIAGLPLSYATKLGEKGAQLSGGQKQRIAIARALIRNPKILLLDEATSALDAESEKVVQKTLDDAKVGRTCIVIAHRLITIKDADVICVIHGGKVAEMGTHEELLQSKGIYYNMYNLY